MTDDLERIEIGLLFEAIYRLYGYDFRHYSYASARRLINKHIKDNKFSNIAALQHQVLHDKHDIDALLLSLSINVTEMFRDPVFFKQLRNKVIPLFSHDEHLKIWHAGCSSGEEAYSMAIILKELDLLKRTQLYATDFNNNILKKAKEGIISLKSMQKNIRNYQQSGGKQDFSNYYTAQNNSAILNQALKKNIMFSNHDLAGDSSFSEMHIIICRNVLIYFDRELQDRVFQLFIDSLCEGGMLCLGAHETLGMSKFHNQFDIFSESQRIYKKKDGK